mgnify:FL=1
MIRWMIQSPLYFIPLAALLTACIGLEPEIAVGEHLGTYHLDRTPWLNENNPGWQLTVGRLQVGGYLNSFGNMSFYVARRFDSYPFSASYGLVTGYFLPVAPMVLKTVKIRRVIIGIIPPALGLGAVHFGIEK